MSPVEDSLTKNQDKVIRIIRMMGAVIFIFGVIMAFIYHQTFVGCVLMVMGFFEIVMTPRVLEWVLAVRQRDLKENEIKNRKE